MSLTAEEIAEQCVRNENIERMFRTGNKQKDIGACYGISCQRVQQILSRRGVNRMDGGVIVRALLKYPDFSKREKQRDERATKMFGCSDDTLVQINGSRLSSGPHRKTIAGRFREQKANASTRGIIWEITLPEWWQIWQESGRWGDRGTGKGYCMARYGDSGAYVVGNVYICTVGQNSSDSYLVRNLSKKPSASGTV